MCRRYHAEWDDQAPVTREGQLIFFFQFLQTGGLWEEFLRQCPLHYTGNRGSGAHNIMDTVMLSVLAGLWRYAQINAIRGDRINPGLLGMSGVASEDAVRLAMGRIDEKPGLDWLSIQILASISPAFGFPWIPDIDVTVKPRYGHQQGAAVGYNPIKFGRPSHVYHSYFVANLRISLGVEIRPGNEHANVKGLPGLWSMLEKLPRHQWPTFSRGDCGYGNETTILDHEQRDLPYLFKLRHTAKVKELVQRVMRQGAPWQDCGDGWQALRLSGWTCDRRVILVRQSPAGAKTAKPSCPMPKERAGTPVPPLGVARSPCLSPRWMRPLFPPRHAQALPRLRRCRKQLRRAQEPMGLERLHLAAAGLLPAHGQSHRASCHANQQRVASHPRHHGAMERGAALDAAVDPRAAPLASRKVASRPSRRRRTTPQRIENAQNCNHPGKANTLIFLLG